MFLGAYHFDGDPDRLLAAYRRLLAGYAPDSLDLHVCVLRGPGITVLDACPSAERFEEFSRGAEFAGAVEAAGLPVPRVEPLGEVHAAWMGGLEGTGLTAPVGTALR